MNSRRLFATFSMFFCVCSGALGEEAKVALLSQIQRTISACSGISARLSELKSTAGINTGLSGIGTVAGGVAVGAGIKKSETDITLEQWEDTLDALKAKQSMYASKYNDIDLDDALLKECLAKHPSQNYQDLVKTNKAVSELQTKVNTETEKSKNLGDIRTGAMGTAALTNSLGTFMAKNNIVDDDLQTNINSCIHQTNALSTAYNAAMSEGETDIITLQRATRIVNACSPWKNVDLSKINKRATGAAISGGVGAVTAIAGTITSSSANSVAVRNDNSDKGKQKEHNLNTASNVLAGGTTIASAVSTVFNATQISAIKKAADVADKCEEALKQ